jgi:eukaryotic-like serine/threonine-protein kinase
MGRDPEPADGGPGGLARYELLDRVGAGSMGTVYRAVDRRSGRIVAVKLVHEHLQADPAYVARFRREARVAGLLNSPYTVRVLDSGSDQGRSFIVSEFVDGTPLGTVLRTERLSPGRALRIAAQVAMALAEAERRGVVHRDIKPDNILLTRDGPAKVADFGISHLASATGVTTAGMFLGTMAYAAPERYRGEGDIRADIYSLGVTLFYMLAGELPFVAENAPMIMRLHQEELPPLEKLIGVPSPVAHIAGRCLEKDPDRRYQHPSDLVAALERVRRLVSDPAPDDPLGTDDAWSRRSADAGRIPEDGLPRGLWGGSGAAVDGGQESHPPAVAWSRPRERGRRFFPLAVIAGALVVVATVALTLSLRTARGGPGGETVTPGGRGGLSATPSVVVTRQAAASSPDPVSPTAGPVTPVESLTPTPTAVATTVVPQLQSIVAGKWEHNFTVISNTCGAGLKAGERWARTLSLRELQQQDDRLSEGERFNLFDSDDGFIGAFAFTWPVLRLELPLRGGGGFVALYFEFFTETTAWSRWEDHLTSASGECVILSEEERPPGFVPRQ